MLSANVMSIAGRSPLPPARPFLKWAGGKARLLEQYQPFIPKNFDHYHEPFLGGGALFFYLAPSLQQQGKQAFLSDLNPELVNVYQCVKAQVDALLGYLEMHQARHCEEHYYAVRNCHEMEPGDCVARAARFIYLNKTCYNGLYRVNSKGHFNVPMGRYKNPRIYAPELLRAASAALQVAEIFEAPFAAVLQRAKSTRDFVYFDPPYHPLNETSKFTAYSRYRFATEDQVELQQAMTQLAARKVQILASNSDCEFVRKLYEGFQVETILAARSINSKASKRGKITEVLARN